MFSYDGYRLDTLLTVEDVDRPIMADIRTQEENYDDLEGSLLYTVAHDSKVITVTVRADRPWEDTHGLDGGFEKMRRILGGHLYRKAPCDLVLPDAPDLTERAVLANKSEIEKLVYARRAELEFLCPVPFSWGKTNREVVLGGEKLNVLVVGTALTAPVAIVSAEGPFTINFDDEAFEVTGSVTGDVIIDARDPREENTGRQVFNADTFETVAFSLFSNFPVWEPGAHTVQCDRNFSLQWTERWL